MSIQEQDQLSYIINIAEKRNLNKDCLILQHCFNSSTFDYYWDCYKLIARHCDDKTIKGSFYSDNGEEVFKFKLYHGTLKCITLKNTFDYLKFEDIGKFIDWLIEAIQYMPDFTVNKSHMNIVFEKQ